MARTSDSQLVVPGPGMPIHLPLPRGVPAELDAAVRAADHDAGLDQSLLRLQQQALGTLHLRALRYLRTDVVGAAPR